MDHAPARRYGPSHDRLEPGEAQRPAARRDSNLRCDPGNLVEIPNMTQYKIAVIAGDGIGKEVVPEGQRVFEEIGRAHV